MKKTLFTIAMLLLPATFAACSSTVEEEEMFPYGIDELEEGKVEVVENKFLKLEFYPETTQFTLTEKQTGNQFHSNPPGSDSDPNASAVTQRLMRSQLSVKYSDETGGSTPTVFSQEHSVSKGLYQYTMLENGIEVDYSIGDVDRVYFIPLAIPESRWNEFIVNLEKTEQSKLKNLYKIIDINKIKSDAEKAATLELYPDADTELIYEFRIVENENKNTSSKKQAEGLFEKAGYTVEDYEEDLQRYAVSYSSNKPFFNVTIRYELDEGEFKVTVPFERIQYKQAYPIIELNVLPYFMSGGLEDEGFMLVPDGSGAIINMNNGRNNQNSYVNSVYGWDEGLYREAIVSDNKAPLPVFGMQLNDSTVLCVLEEASAYANILADVSGRDSSYNCVYANYAMIHRESYKMGSRSDKEILFFQQELPNENIVQRYIFCSDSGYMGMANEYRDYLMARYPTLQKQTGSTVPVAVEILGAVNKTQSVMGLPIDLPLKLTSYKEATSIVNQINALGFRNVNYKLTGWFNDSIQHSVPSSIKLISQLGSKNDLKNLASTINTSNGKLHLEADFLYMRDNSLFDGFSLNNDAARYLNRERIESYPYSFVWYGERDQWGKLSYLATPKYMMGLIDNYAKTIQQYGTNNIAFRTIGNSLAADYNENRLVSREAAMNMQVAKLSQLSESGTSIMVNNGYIFTVPYVDFIMDTPVSSQGFQIIDNEIPFYQIVLHGLVPYSARPINFAEDYTLNILRSVETGAGLSFSFMNASTSVLEQTKFHQYYANEFGKWANDAGQIYTSFSDELSGIYEQYIVNYEILADGVTLTEYEDGTKVVVNKSLSDYKYSGKTVPTRDYVVIKRGA